jgi:hypothetical protein
LQCCLGFSRLRNPILYPFVTSYILGHYSAANILQSCQCLDQYFDIGYVSFFAQLFYALATNARHEKSPEMDRWEGRVTDLRVRDSKAVDISITSWL